MAGRGGNHVRPQDHHHGIQPCGAGTKRDQGVHVGGAVPERLPCAQVEMPAGERHDAQGQQSDRQPAHLLVPGMHAHVAAENPVQHHRHAHAKTQPGMAQQAVVMRPVRLFLLVEPGCVVGCDGLRIVTGISDGKDQGVCPHVTGHADDSLGEIHLRRLHPRNLAQGGLDLGDAARASRAHDVQIPNLFPRQRRHRVFSLQIHGTTVHGPVFQAALRRRSIRPVMPGACRMTNPVAGTGSGGAEICMGQRDAITEMSKNQG